MPQTLVRVFREADGTCPFLEWLDDLERRQPRAYQKCLAGILLLAQLGNELRRPQVDTLRDGIRELRLKVGKVHYRILFFFHGSHAVCLSHGITKGGAVPDDEIDEARRRKTLVEGDPDRYTVNWEE